MQDQQRRTRVQNPYSRTPYNGIGEIIAYFQNQYNKLNGIHATAFYIGKNILLTAAYAICDYKNRMAKQVYFYPAQPQGYKKIKIKAKQFKKFQCNNTYQKHNIYNIALIQLQQNQELKIQIEPLKFNLDFINQFNLNSQLIIAGFPKIIYNIQDNEQMYQEQRRIKNNDLFYLYYNHKTSNGQGGSPIIKRDTNNNYKLIGMHLAQKFQNNRNSIKFGLIIHSLKSTIQIICELAEQMGVQNLLGQNYKPTYKKLQQSLKNIKKQNQLLKKQNEKLKNQNQFLINKKKIIKINPDHYQVDFKIIIGRGSFGDVFKGKNKKTGQKVAVKRISLVDNDQQNQKIQNLFIKEIQILSKLDHPNIVKFYGYDKDQYAFYIYMEFCESNFEQITKRILKNNWKLTELQCLFLIMPIIEAFFELSSKQQGLIHRDIKPQNILLKDNCYPKLADFGLAKIFPNNTSKKINNTKELETTLHYMAPQLIKGMKYTQKCDIWSFGCVIYQLLHGKLPWRMISQKQKLIQIIQNNDFYIQRNDLSENLVSFLQICFQKKQHNRASWKILISHPLYKYYKKQLKPNQYFHQDVGQQIQAFLQNHDNALARKLQDLQFRY